MKKSSILIISLFTIFLLSGCTSKAQTDIIYSNSKDINDLMKTLIQKEKDINELNKKLENCKEQKTKK